MITVNPIGRLDSINAASNWMRGTDAVMGLAFAGGNAQSLLNSEKQLTADMFNNQTLYKASSLQEDSHKKLINSNIKRTFSTFA